MADTKKTYLCSAKVGQVPFQDITFLLEWDSTLQCLKSKVAIEDIDFGKGTKGKEKLEAFKKWVGRQRRLDLRKA